MTTGIYLLSFGSKSYYKYYIGQSKNIEQRYIQHCNKLLSGTHTEAIQEAYNLNGYLPKLQILLECHEDYLLPMERLYAQAHRNMFAKATIRVYLELNTMPLLADIPEFTGRYSHKKHKRYLRDLVSKIPFESSVLERAKLGVEFKVKVLPQILLEPTPAYLDLFQLT